MLPRPKGFRMSPAKRQDKTAKRQEVFTLIARLREALDHDDLVRISELSRQLKNTADYVLVIPETFTSGVVDQIEGLLHEAAQKTAHSDMGDSTAQRVGEFHHQIQSIQAAQAALNDASDGTCAAEQS